MMPEDVSAAALIFAESGLGQNADFSERLSYLLRQENRLCFIAEIGRIPVGALLATYNGFHVFLSHLAVKEEYRRQGLARCLHEELQAHAARLDAKGIIADSQLAATGFYDRLGYALPGAVFVINRLR